MKEALPERIRSVIVDSCNDAGVTLVDVVMRGQARQLILDVFIDTLEGVTHDHCRDVSRGIDERLQDDEFAGRLRAVDVSSPGAEAPVKFLWQLRFETRSDCHADHQVILRLVYQAQAVVIRAGCLGVGT